MMLQHAALSHTPTQRLAGAMLSVMDALSALRTTSTSYLHACHSLILQGYCSALQHLLRFKPHSLVGLPDEAVLRIAHSACTKTAKGGAQGRAKEGDTGLYNAPEAAAAAAAAVVEQSATLAATVRAHVLELDEAAAMQVIPLRPFMTCEAICDHATYLLVCSLWSFSLVKSQQQQACHTMLDQHLHE